MKGPDLSPDLVNEVVAGAEQEIADMVQRLAASPMAEIPTRGHRVLALSQAILEMALEDPTWSRRVLSISAILLAREVEKVLEEEKK
jgi:hypothetical protein